MAKHVTRVFSSGVVSDIVAALTDAARAFREELRAAQMATSRTTGKEPKLEERLVREAWASEGLLPTLLNGFNSLVQAAYPPGSSGRVARLENDGADQLFRVAELCGSILSLMREDDRNSQVKGDWRTDSPCPADASGDVKTAPCPYAEVFVTMVMRHLWNINMDAVESYPWLLLLLLHSNGWACSDYLRGNVLAFCCWMGELYQKHAHTEPMISPRATLQDGETARAAPRPNHLVAATRSRSQFDKRPPTPPSGVGENRADRPPGKWHATLAVSTRGGDVAWGERLDLIASCGARLGTMYAAADVKALWCISQRQQQQHSVRALVPQEKGSSVAAEENSLWKSQYGTPPASGMSNEAHLSVEAFQKTVRDLCTLLTESERKWAILASRQQVENECDDGSGWSASRTTSRTAAALRTSLLMGLRLCLFLHGSKVGALMPTFVESLTPLVFLALDLEDGMLANLLLQVARDQSLHSDATFFRMYGDPIALVGYEAGSYIEGSPYDIFLHMWQSHYEARFGSGVVVAPGSLTGGESRFLLWHWAALAHSVTQAVRGSSFLLQSAAAFMANIVPVMEGFARNWQYSESASLAIHYFLEIADAILSSTWCPDDVFDIFCVEDYKYGWTAITTCLQEYASAVLTSSDVWELLGIRASVDLQSAGDAARVSTLWWPNEPFDVTRHRIRILRHYTVVSRALKDGGDAVEGWVCTVHPAQFLTSVPSGAAIRILTGGVSPSTANGNAAIRLEVLELLQELARPPPPVHRASGESAVTACPGPLSRPHVIKAFCRLLYLRFLRFFRRGCDPDQYPAHVRLVEALARTVRVLCQASEDAVREAERLGIAVMIANEMEHIRLEAATEALGGSDMSRGLSLGRSSGAAITSPEIHPRPTETTLVRPGADGLEEIVAICVGPEPGRSARSSPTTLGETPGGESATHAAVVLPKLSFANLLPPAYYTSNGDTGGVQEQSRLLDDATAGPNPSATDIDRSDCDSDDPANPGDNIWRSGNQVDTERLTESLSRPQASSLATFTTAPRITSSTRRRASVGRGATVMPLAGLFSDDSLHAEVIYLSLALLVGPNGMIREQYSQGAAVGTKYASVLFSIQYHFQSIASAGTISHLAARVSDSCANLGVRILLRFLDPRDHLRWKSLLLGRQIGRGTYGTVYAARINSPQCVQLTDELAVKVAPVPLLPHDHEVIVTYHSEVLALTKCEGQTGIVQLLDFGFDGSQYLLIMPRYRHSLKAWRAQTWGRKSVAEDSCRVWQCLALLHRVLEAVEAIHAGCVRHNDLKADNIFVRDVDVDGVPVVVLGDFGESEVITAGYQPNPDRSRGTEAIRPPEELIPHSNTATQPLSTSSILSSDVWSCGCLLFELLVGELLFAQMHIGKLFRCVSGEDDLFEPWQLDAVQGAGSDVLALMRGMLHMSVVERPSAAAAMQMARKVIVASPKYQGMLACRTVDPSLQQHADPLAELQGDSGTDTMSASCSFGAASSPERPTSTCSSALTRCARVLPCIWVSRDDVGISELYALGASHVLCFRPWPQLNEHFHHMESSLCGAALRQALLGPDEVAQPRTCCVEHNSVERCTDDTGCVALFLLDAAVRFLVEATKKNGMAVVLSADVGGVDVAHLACIAFISVTYVVPAVAAATHVSVSCGGGVDVYRCASVLAKLASRLAVGRCLATSSLWPGIFASDVCSLPRVAEPWPQEWFRCLCAKTISQISPSAGRESGEDDRARSGPMEFTIIHPVPCGTISLSVPRDVWEETECGKRMGALLPLLQYLDGIARVYPTLLSAFPCVAIRAAAPNATSGEGGGAVVCHCCGMPVLLVIGGHPYVAAAFPLYAVSPTSGRIITDDRVERQKSACWGEGFHLQRVPPPNHW